VALEGRAGGLLTDLFSARTGVLLGGLPPEAVSGYLSGLLVGHEVREGLAGRPAARPLLVGGGALVARYREAFALAGIAAAEGPAEATVLGFRRLVALAGGLTT
jgi:2-dehydro-3-deoxygalactonokinase